MLPIPVFDGHNDSLSKLNDDSDSSVEFSNNGQINLSALKKGGVVGGFFAIQVPAELIDERSNEYGFSYAVPVII